MNRRHGKLDQMHKAMMTIHYPKKEGTPLTGKPQRDQLIDLLSTKHPEVTEAFKKATEIGTLW